MMLWVRMREGRRTGWGEGWEVGVVGVRAVAMRAGVTVTSCGFVKKTPSATKTEPIMARFCGVPLALMNPNTPPPCRSEPVATCDAAERTVGGRLCSK